MSKVVSMSGSPLAERGREIFCMILEAVGLALEVVKAEVSKQWPQARYGPGTSTSGLQVPASPYPQPLQLDFKTVFYS